MEMGNIRGGPSSLALVFMEREITDEQLECYNDDLHTFYREYLDWLFKMRDLKNKRSLLTPLGLWVSNNGSCPAQDVDVEVHFPNFVSVSLDENTLGLPPEPKPPELPKSRQIDILSSLTSIPPFPIDPVPFNPPSFSDLINSPPEASIHKDERGTCVTMRWDSIKHDYRHQILPVPHVQFESYESLRGFQLEYRISAANLPSASKGTFDVKVKIKQPE